jgi:hypothetical protein
MCSGGLYRGVTKRTRKRSVDNVVGEADYGVKMVVWGGQGTFFEESKAARKQGWSLQGGIVPVCCNSFSARKY